MSRLKAGKQVVVPGDGQTLIHPSSAYNTGRMIAEIIKDTRTTGEAFTCGHETYMTADEYYHLFARALKVEANLVHIPKELLYPLENKLIPDDLLSELTGFNVAFSEEKFIKFLPDFVWEKSLDQAAAEYIQYYENKGDIPEFKESYEDRLIEGWSRCKKAFQP